MADQHLHYTYGLPPPAPVGYYEHIPQAVQNAYSYSAEPHHLQMLPASTLSRAELNARKRPKYTRSKTGCLTCRAKKIKCDEAKPMCMRCAHGQRECAWPDVVPTRKRSASRKGSSSSAGEDNNRPSTASSSASYSPPSTAGGESTPPLNLTEPTPSIFRYNPTMIRESEPMLMPPRHASPETIAPYASDLLPVIPELQQQQQQQYEHYYAQPRRYSHPGSSYEPYPAPHHPIPRHHTQMMPQSSSQYPWIPAQADYHYVR